MTTWPSNDLADLLADAMRRPLTESAHRPRHIHLRGNPRWQELFPHLKELGIEVSIHDELPRLEVVYEDFLRQMRKAGSGLQIVYFPGPPPLDEQFPATAKWVQGHGHIEIGEQDGIGFVVRALDSGGMVFEDDKAETLAEAMAALEKGLAEWFNEEGVEF